MGEGAVTHTTPAEDDPALLSLLGGARAEPHDDAPRLVLADWLDEHGEPERAEFIRCQLMLAHGTSALEPSERASLRRRTSGHQAR